MARKAPRRVHTVLEAKPPVQIALVALAGRPPPALRESPERARASMLSGALAMVAIGDGPPRQQAVARRDAARLSTSNTEKRSSPTISLHTKAIGTVRNQA
jgi:hypothetical protein